VCEGRVVIISNHCIWKNLPFSSVSYAPLSFALRTSILTQKLASPILELNFLTQITDHFFSFTISYFISNKEHLIQIDATLVSEFTLKLSDYGYIIDNGRICYQGTVKELIEDEDVRKTCGI